MVIFIVSPNQTRAISLLGNSQSCYLVIQKELFQTNQSFSPVRAILEQDRQISSLSLETALTVHTTMDVSQK